MNTGIPLTLARKIHLYLELVDAGQRTPDALKLLQAAEALRRCDELRLAARCERIARRFLPNLRGDGSTQS